MVKLRTTPYGEFKIGIKYTIGGVKMDVVFYMNERVYSKGLEENKTDSDRFETNRPSEVVTRKMTDEDRKYLEEICNPFKRSACYIK